MPIPIPNSEDVVKRETCLPTISPRLFFFAKVTLICALDAEDINMQIFLPIFAVEAKKRNIPGNCRVKSSIKIENFIVAIAKNRHFLISSSKWPPYRLAKTMPPICPRPSFKTHVYAAAASCA